MQTVKAQLTQLLPHYKIETLDCPEAIESIKKLYGVSLEEIPVTYGNRGLRFWEAGALMIYESPSGERLPLLHLKKQDPELIAHELVHFIRKDMDEMRFEELFAYRTSKRKWRAWWGPIFRNTLDVWIFLGCSMCSIIHPFCSAIPALWLLIKGVLLARDHKYLIRTAAMLKQIYPKEDPYHRLIHLTDAQILSKQHEPAGHKNLDSEKSIHNNR